MSVTEVVEHFTSVCEGDRVTVITPPPVMIATTVSVVQEVERRVEPAHVVTQAAGARGPAGTTGATGPSGDVSYIHTRDNESLVWTVQHNRGSSPGGFHVTDQDGNQRFPTITHPTVNIALLTFAEAAAGVVYVS